MMKKETSLSIVSSQICICIGDIVYLPYILYIYVNKCITSLYCSVFMMAEHCCQACYGGSSLIWIILFRLMTGTSNWSRQNRRNCGYCHNFHDFCEGKLWMFEIDVLKVDQIGDGFSRDSRNYVIVLVFPSFWWQTC